MAYTTTDVETLERAISSGTLSVRFADRLITYQSLDAMRAARKEMLNEIASAASTGRKRTLRVYQKGQGY